MIKIADLRSNQGITVSKKFGRRKEERTHLKTSTSLLRLAALWKSDRSRASSAKGSKLLAAVNQIKTVKGWSKAKSKGVFEITQSRSRRAEVASRIRIDEGQKGSEGSELRKATMQDQRRRYEDSKDTKKLTSMSWQKVNGGESEKGAS